MLSSLNILAHAEEIADSVAACAVKNNILSGVHTDRKALDLNCHFYVVKATLENKCMPCFQDYDYIFRKGAEKMYQVSPSSPTSKMIKKEVEATGRENTPPGHSLIAQMKSGEKNLERVYFYLRLSVFQSFNRMAISIFVKNWLARPPIVYCSFFYFAGGQGILSFRRFFKRNHCAACVF